MKKPRSILGLSALLACSLSMSAQGATLLTEVAPPNRNNFTGWVGMRFTVGTQDLLVTSLGFQDEGGNGLAAAHTVTIFTGTSSATYSGATVNVVAGSGTSLLDNYRYVNLASAVTLLAGQTYTLAATVTSGATTDKWTDTGTTSPGVSISGAVTGGQSAYWTGTTFADGTGAHALRWGPANMQFTVVPEPTAALLGGLGVLGLLRRRRLA